MAYTKKDWQDGEVITKDALNNMENAIDAIDKRTGDATKIEKGVVKQCKNFANVTAPDATAVGDSYNKTQIDNIVNVANGCKGVVNGLVNALKEAGIMAGE